MLSTTNDEVSNRFRFRRNEVGNGDDRLPTPILLSFSRGTWQKGIGAG
jgi:hypothetical protein